MNRYGYGVYERSTIGEYCILSSSSQGEGKGISALLSRKYRGLLNSLLIVYIC